jgi:hypothetical protein
MTPPIQKDWWLAAALTGAALPAAMGQAPNAADGRQSAIVTSVTQGASGPGASTPIYIEATRGQKLTTGPNQTLHVLFSDQSALTVGPNSEITIAEYRYDPKTKDGNVLVDMTKGLLRVVGGFISKKNETIVRTSTATIGIRGGITMVETNGQNTSGTFLFGQGMSATDTNGNTQTITRAGFGTSFGDNQPPSTPRRIPVSELNAQLSRLESGGGGNRGNNQPGGAPPGQLLSTGNTGSNPGDTLANDRLKNVVDTSQGTNPSQTLRNILGSGQTPNVS